uniref:Uncharacterized protein n=1 Tax=Gorilla gorilla gorilla TaxID=9595 RepID=G3SHH5_GORGO
MLDAKEETCCDPYQERHYLHQPIFIWIKLVYFVEKKCLRKIYKQQEEYGCFKVRRTLMSTHSFCEDANELHEPKPS